MSSQISFSSAMLAPTAGSFEYFGPHQCIHGAGLARADNPLYFY